MWGAELVVGVLAGAGALLAGVGGHGGCGGVGVVVAALMLGLGNVCGSVLGRGWVVVLKRGAVGRLLWGVLSAVWRWLLGLWILRVWLLGLLTV